MKWSTDQRALIAQIIDQAERSQDNSTSLANLTRSLKEFDARTSESDLPVTEGTLLEQARHRQLLALSQSFNNSGRQFLEASESEKGTQFARLEKVGIQLSTWLDLQARSLKEVVDDRVQDAFLHQSMMRLLLSIEIGVLLLFCVLPLMNRVRRLVSQVIAEKSELESANAVLQETRLELERKSYEQELALQHARDQTTFFEFASNRFQQLFGGLPVGCLTYDRDGMIQEWNPAMTELFKVEPFMAVYQHLLAIFNLPQGSHLILDVMHDVLENGIKREFEWTFTPPDSADAYILYVYSYPLKNVSGQIIGGIISAFNITRRKRVEEALRVSEERFNLAVKGSDVGIWDWHIATDTIYWSPQTMSVMDVTAENFSGAASEFWRRVHPQDRSFARRALDDHLKNRNPYAVTVRVITDRGETRWIHNRGQAIWDDSGEPTRMAGSLEDVTERKSIELALAESEKRFDLAVRGSSVGIYDYDAEHETTYFSPVARELYGLSSDIVVDCSLAAACIHEEDREEALEAFHRCLRDGGALSVEYRVRRNDGIRWVHLRGLTIQNELEEVVRLSGSIEDITERKQTELALKESELRFKDVTIAAGEYVYEVDVNGVLTFITDRITSILGYEVDEMIGKSCAVFMQPTEHDRLSTRLGWLYSRGAVFRDQDYPCVHKEGRQVWIRLSGTPIWGEAGELIGYRGTGLDVTGQKKAEFEVAEANSALYEMVESIRDCFFAIGADLKFTFANRAAARFLQITPEAIVAQGVFEVRSGWHDSPFEEHCRMVLSEGKESAFEMFDEGAERWLAFRIYPRAQGLSVFYQDITHRKVIEATLAQNLDEIREKNLELERQRQELEKANALLADLATTDGLTGLRNHKAFQIALDDAIKSANSKQGQLSLIFFDVDHFKQFNDSFGHPAGDDVLRQIAAITKESIRDFDLAARYGGEEFVVLLPRTGADVATQIAERIRAAIENAGWSLRPVTASFGVSTLGSGENAKQQLVDSADRALYRSKMSGRNQVSVASTDASLVA